MSIYLALGTYSYKSAEEFLGSDSDRRAAVEASHNSVGTKVVDYHILRGQYDFCVIARSQFICKDRSIDVKGQS